MYRDDNDDMHDVHCRDCADTGRIVYGRTADGLDAEACPYCDAGRVRREQRAKVAAAYSALIQAESAARGQAQPSLEWPLRRSLAVKEVA